MIEAPWRCLDARRQLAISLIDRQSPAPLSRKFDEQGREPPLAASGNPTLTLSVGVYCTHDGHIVPDPVGKGSVTHHTFFRKPSLAIGCNRALILDEDVQAYPTQVQGAPGIVQSQACRSGAVTVAAVSLVANSDSDLGGPICRLQIFENHETDCTGLG